MHPLFLFWEISWGESSPSLVHGKATKWSVAATILPHHTAWIPLAPFIYLSTSTAMQPQDHRKEPALGLYRAICSRLVLEAERYYPGVFLGRQQVGSLAALRWSLADDCNGYERHLYANDNLHLKLTSVLATHLYFPLQQQWLARFSLFFSFFFYPICFYSWAAALNVNKSVYVMASALSGPPLLWNS